MTPIDHRLPVVIVDSSDALLQILYERNRFGTPSWFRGHACEDWTLSTVLDRRNLRTGRAQLLEQFRMQGQLRHTNPPDRRDTTAWIVIARHHGLPTAMMDWTKSPLTAAYFVTSHESRPGPGVIWQLLPEILNRIYAGVTSLFTIDNEKSSAYLNSIYRNEDGATHGAIAVLAPEVDVRMAAQAAAFTIHGSPVPLEQLELPDNLPYSFLTKILITERAKSDIARLLDAVGINRAVLFPDLTNLAQHLVQQFEAMTERMERGLQAHVGEAAVPEVWSDYTRDPTS